MTENVLTASVEKDNNGLAFLVRLLGRLGPDVQRQAVFALVGACSRGKVGDDLLRLWCESRVVNLA